MDNSKKYIIGVSILILLLLGYILYQWREIKDLQLDNAALKSNGSSLGDGVQIANSAVVDPSTLVDTAKSANVPIDIIKKDANSKGKDLSSVTTTTVSTPGKKEDGLGSSRVEEPVRGAPSVTQANPTLVCDPFSYLKNTQVLDISEPFGNFEIPFGEAKFKAWEPKPWTIEIKPRVYESSVIIAEDENHSKTAYSTFNITVDKKTYKIPVTSAKITYTEPQPSLSWNPRIMLGISAGMSIPLSFVWGPNLGVTVGSYGKFKSSPDWYFGQISVGYEVQKKDVYFTLTPALYRISNHIPLTESLYIGPEVGVNTSGEFMFLSSFKLGL